MSMTAKEYVETINEKRSREARYCAHPDCKARLVDSQGRGARLAWDNENPYCGACLKRVGEEAPHKSLIEYGVCSKGHSFEEYGLSSRGACKRCQKDWDKASNKRRGGNLKRAGYTPLLNLKASREEQGVSRREIAQACYLNVDNIRDYENKGTRCAPKAAEDLASYLGVSLSYLAGEQKPLEWGT